MLSDHVGISLMFYISITKWRRRNRHSILGEIKKKKREEDLLIKIKKGKKWKNMSVIDRLKESEWNFLHLFSVRGLQLSNKRISVALI